LKTPDQELIEIAERLELAGNPEILSADQPKLDALIAAADELNKSFSGSWFGYHSRVYYAGLKPAPPGAHFSQEWGLKDSFSMNSIGDWKEFAPDAVDRQIQRRAGNPDLGALETASNEAKKIFISTKSDIISILASLNGTQDKFIENLAEKLDALEALEASQIVKIWIPQGSVIISDITALNQGYVTPPHFAKLADFYALSNCFNICRSSAEIAKKLAAHLGRVVRHQTRDERIGTNVFIGHGRSSAWRELKDFFQDRLRLPYDEFNRVPVAGVANITRLADMLDAAAIAFLVMTAEDETAEGKMRARENVVHEVGLFQGRLGFSRAIVVLEEGCEEFSNIQGLGQIRFAPGKIAGAFEQIRQVMEREKLIDGGG
jgi:predicted nucleotide-binding protein